MGEFGVLGRLRDCFRECQRGEDILIEEQRSIAKLAQLFNIEEQPSPRVVFQTELENYLSR